MVKKREVNISQVIRDYVQVNPTAKSQDVADVVSKQIGKKIASSYVSNIKGLMKNGKGKKSKKSLISATQAGNNLSQLDVELAKQEGIMQGLKLAKSIFAK